MSLATGFAAYLSRPLDTMHEFAAQLESAGLSTAAMLLGTCAKQGHAETDAGSVLTAWSGRRCSIGPRPPPDCVAGDVWFDIGELTAMVLLPRPPEELVDLPAGPRERLTPYVSWLSTVPAAVWQVRGWVLATGGRERMPNGPPERAPATGLPAREAHEYAAYFGKSMADAHDWYAVTRAFPRPVPEQLWPDDEPELGGYVEEGVVRVLRREDAMHQEPHVEDAEETENGHELEDESTPLEGVRVRTHVSTQLGLFDSSPSTGRWPRTRGQ